MQPRILTFVDYFLPGFKAGGPARTIANLVEHLGDEASFLIVTRDRDLNDAEPYPDVQRGEWTDFGPAKVYYARPEEMTIAALSRLMRSTDHDIVYLNSLFSPRMTQLPLIARRLRLVPENRRWILAPRGELGASALRIKATKKRLALAAGQRLRLFDGIIWQASTEMEAQDIQTALPGASLPLIACDLPTHFNLAHSRPTRQQGNPLRIVFLSRVVPIKNLAFALQVLSKVKFPIKFGIYGPIEDPGYWSRCRALIDQLPGHVEATYCGAVEPKAVQETLAAYDLFFLPSGGENFGHVMAEALQAGLPLLISDQTPWRRLRQHGVGEALPLSDQRAFVSAIENYAAMTTAQWAEVTGKVQRYVENLRASTQAAVQQSRTLFGLPDPSSSHNSGLPR